MRVFGQALRSTRGARNIQNLPYIASYKYTSFDFHRAVNHYHDVLHFIHILQKGINNNYYFIVISRYLRWKYFFILQPSGALKIRRHEHNEEFYGNKLII